MADNKNLEDKVASPHETEDPAVSEQSTATAATTQVTQGTTGMLPAQHWLEAAEENNEVGNPGDDDADSAVEDTASSTASISSSIIDYRTINGRRYHSETSSNTQYWAANDERQNESLDIIHHLLTLSLGGKLFLAPLDKKTVGRVLDIGTGTGIWAIDFADENPQAEVIGTDISPIQPSWVPPNLKFEIEDFTQAWTFPPKSFDYVHMRYLYGSVPDWHALFREAYRVCRPGGWVESFEASPMIYSDDGTVGDTSALAEWGKFFLEGGKKLGRTFTPLDDDLQEKGMEEAGFVDMQVRKQKVPIGGWAADKKLREIGRFSQLSLDSDLEGYVLYMANLLLGWGRDEVTVYCAQFRREMRSGNYHPYYNQRVVWARKPDIS